MKNYFFIPLFIMTFASSLITAQMTVDKEIIEPDMVTLTGSEQPGGLYMPSIAKDGKYVKILIVFVQFKDDDWNTGWSEWPVNQPPSGWMGTATIDQTTSQNSTNQNLTHYYTEMSLGNYKVIGDCYNVITPQTRDEYITAGTKRGGINREALLTLNNNTNVNFAEVV